MKSLSFFVILVLVVGTTVVRPLDGVAQTTQQNSEARKLFVEGRDLQDDGKFADAEKKFREALTKYPKADQSDRTAYYLIATLVRLGRVTDARSEIEAFRKNYPQSSWKSDVDEKAVTLGWNISPFGTGSSPFGTGNSPFGLEPHVGNQPLNFPSENFPFGNSELGFHYSVGATPFSFGWSFPGSSSLESEVLRMILEKDIERGIEVSKERLKADPSDPAVISNLGTIANSSSPQALQFLMEVVSSRTANPNAKSQALFWASRRGADKDLMTRSLMDMLNGPNGKELETAVADVLQHLSSVERRNALNLIAQSQNADRTALLERIYRAGTPAVRMDVVRTVAQMSASSTAQAPDRRALTFLTDAAQNDKDTSVRRAVIQALAARKDVDVKTLESLLKSIPSPTTTAK